MRFDCILFDLDGTLLDTSRGVLKAVDYAIREMGLPDLDQETKKTFIGPPIYEPLAEIYHLDQKECDRATELFRNAYKDQFLFEAVPYDGIYELLSSLKTHGYKLAVATNKRNDYAIRLLEHFDFPKYFDYMLGSDFANTMKKADIIQACLEKLGCSDPDRAIIVGDTVHDLKGARKIGIHFTGVNYGFGFKKEDDYAELNHEKVFANTKELKAYFMRAES